MMNETLFHMIAKAPTPVAPFSHAVEVDGWVFVTGQMPTMPDDPDAALPEGIEAQTHQVMHNLEIVLNEIIGSIHNGTLGGTSFTINLENGGEVIEYNPDYTVPAEVKTLADDTVQGIIDGSITIEMAE